MNWKTLSIAGGSLVVVAFLLGFIPEYRKGRNLEGQLASTRQELESERQKSQMDELGLLIGYVYVQTNLKNFGLASQSSTTFFNRVRTMASQTQDPNRQALFQAALAKRDAITGGLAKGDTSTAAAIQDLFQRTLEASQSGWK